MYICVQLSSYINNTAQNTKLSLYKIRELKISGSTLLFCTPAELSLSNMNSLQFNNTRAHRQPTFSQVTWLLILPRCWSLKNIRTSIFFDISSLPSNATESRQ